MMRNLQTCAYFSAGYYRDEKEDVHIQANASLAYVYDKGPQIRAGVVALLNFKNLNRKWLGGHATSLSKNFNNIKPKEEEMNMQEEDKKLEMEASIEKIIADSFKGKPG